MDGPPGVPRAPGNRGPPPRRDLRDRPGRHRRLPDLLRPLLLEGAHPLHGAADPDRHQRDAGAPGHACHLPPRRRALHVVVPPVRLRQPGPARVARRVPRVPGGGLRRILRAVPRAPVGVDGRVQRVPRGLLRGVRPLVLRPRPGLARVPEHENGLRPLLRLRVLRVLRRRVRPGPGVPAEGAAKGSPGGGQHGDVHRCLRRRRRHLMHRRHHRVVQQVCVRAVRPARARLRRRGPGHVRPLHLLALPHDLRRLPRQHRRVLRGPARRRPRRRRPPAPRQSLGARRRRRLPRGRHGGAPAPRERRDRPDRVLGREPRRAGAQEARARRGVRTAGPRLGRQRRRGRLRGAAAPARRGRGHGRDPHGGDDGETATADGRDCA
mmetsp:Transcript_65614/g.184766  ORF Transcript_65614/g.184766 Transcript_65614/m.184766 type:complete len:380 (+) Transcript_65614:356-1495(+)